MLCCVKDVAEVWEHREQQQQRQLSILNHCLFTLKALHMQQRKSHFDEDTQLLSDSSQHQSPQDKSQQPSSLRLHGNKACLPKSKQNTPRPIKNYRNIKSD